MADHTDMPMPAGLNPVRAERIASGLQMRTVGHADVLAWPLWRLVHIERGSIQILSAEISFEHRGPCLAWIPWARDSRLRFAAGSVGAHVLIGSTLLGNAIGHKAESADLRSVAERQAVMSLQDDAATARRIANCFDGMFHELGMSAASSGTVIEALVKIILIEIWRSQGAPGSYEAATSPSLRLMNRFNVLVESCFRDRWTVSQYARHVGISTDRLTDICKRFRGGSPKQLIDARVETEARLLLENSTHSIEQVADLLGFPSAAQFNRFFKNLNGVPPGAYRRRSQARPDTGVPTKQLDLHEWP
jgi:AraC family transcriptional regulator, transcriptional activator of pobA